MNDETELLTNYIRTETGYAGDIDPDEDLIEVGILDSFSIVSLTMFAQEQFRVEFEGEELVRENIAKLSTLVALIRQKQSSADT